MGCRLPASTPQASPGIGSIHAVAFSPDDTQLASAGADGYMRIWDFASGKVVVTTKRQPNATRGWPLAPTEPQPPRRAWTTRSVLLDVSTGRLDLHALGP